MLVRDAVPVEEDHEPAARLVCGLHLRLVVAQPDGVDPVHGRKLAFEQPGQRGVTGRVRYQDLAVPVRLHHRRGRAQRDRDPVETRALAVGERLDDDADL